MTINHKLRALIFIDRLRLLVEHGNLSSQEIIRLSSELNELAERHSLPPVDDEVA